MIRHESPPAAAATSGRQGEGRNQWIDARSAPLPRELGARLRAARLAAGLSQRALAVQSTVARRHVQNLESGRRAPSVTVVELLDGALNFPPDLLEDLMAFAVSTAGRSRKAAERAAGVRRSR